MVEISKPDFQIWARHNWREGAVEYADNGRVTADNTGENVGAEGWSNAVLPY